MSLKTIHIPLLYLETHRMGQSYRITRLKPHTQDPQSSIFARNKRGIGGMRIQEVILYVIILYNNMISSFLQQQMTVIVKTAPVYH